MDYEEIYRGLNDQGLGFEIGDQDADINELADDIGGSLIKAASDYDNDVAVYDMGDHLLIVGNANGLWAVRHYGE
ncbi:hypothetical protein [Nitrincola iocasae]|uniref:Uncharacterized protein n=1 Tax=Nitrincola iocasae TaxID=2614693 RepID=A0A5J6LB65_9GAMM|nr:hypothetical protein [Nitrincola iocasae]QEW05636.1 hypothetical protein F5I99_03550 [Nitrincola iocasae]